jgi:hypothetical protein
MKTGATLFAPLFIKVEIYRYAFRFSVLILDIRMVFVIYAEICQL